MKEMGSAPSPFHCTPCFCAILELPAEADVELAELDAPAPAETPVKSPAAVPPATAATLKPQPAPSSAAATKAETAAAKAESTTKAEAGAKAAPTAASPSSEKGQSSTDDDMVVVDRKELESDSQGQKPSLKFSRHEWGNHFLLIASLYLRPRQSRRRQERNGLGASFKRGAWCLRSKIYFGMRRYRSAKLTALSCYF